MSASLKDIDCSKLLRRTKNIGYGKNEDVLECRFCEQHFHPMNVGPHTLEDCMLFMSERITRLENDIINVENELRNCTGYENY